MIRARRAEIGDLAALQPRLPARLLAGLTWQLRHSAVVTVTEDGVPVAMAGLFGHDAGWFEAWYMPGRQARRPRTAALAMRIFARLLMALPEDMDVRCLVAAANGEGMRLARLMGFSPLGQQGQRLWLARNTRRPSPIVAASQRQGQDDAHGKIHSETPRHQAAGPV
jgi:hypothetical protein